MRLLRESSREMRLFPRPSVLTVALVLLLLPSRPSRGRPIGVRRGADNHDDDSDEEREHRKMSKAMVRPQWNWCTVKFAAGPSYSLKF